MGHELLEHTADLGIRAWGPSVEAAVAEALMALVEVMGVRGSGPGRDLELRGAGGDDGARLVALLNETIFAVETRGVRIASARVHREGDELAAVLELVDRDGAGEGIGVKAATYHQLAVEEGADGSVEVRVFLDV
ncbi:MAG TPA: archease [Actinomycetota bacterium]|nr:archease [Actinomycetota bacterium]